MFKIRELRWVFSSVLASFFVIAILRGPETIGVSAEWSDGNYHFAAGTSPWWLMFSALIWGLYFLLLQASPAAPGEPLPGVFRRYIAFWIDFAFAIMASAPTMGIVPVFVEWRRTQEFQWQIQRTVSVPGDYVLATVGTLFIALVGIFYFAFPLMRGKPTPGACIAGYQVIADDGNPLEPKTALLRTLLGFFAVGGAIFAPLFGRDRVLGKFWLDKPFKTHAVKPSTIV